MLLQWLIPSLSLAFSSTAGLEGVSVADLDSGGQRVFSEMIKQGENAVIVEKDCAPCRSYLKELKSCSEDLRENLRFISISSARQTKLITSSLPPGAGIYLMTTDKARRLISATPTTIRQGAGGKIQKFVGRMSCEQLAAWSRLK